MPYLDIISACNVYQALYESLGTRLLVEGSADVLVLVCKRATAETVPKQLHLAELENARSAGRMSKRDWLELSSINLVCRPGPTQQERDLKVNTAQ